MPHLFPVFPVVWLIAIALGASGAVYVASCPADEWAASGAQGSKGKWIAQFIIGPVLCILLGFLVVWIDFQRKAGTPLREYRDMQRARRSD